MVNTFASQEEQAEYASRVANISEADIAWFGGWLSADGSIGSNPQRPHIRFCLTDIDPLERFSDLFGNAIYGPAKQHGLGTKPVYEWKLSGWRAKVVLLRVRPWLSVRYAERASLFDAWTARAHRGQKLTPENVAYIREELSSGGVGRHLAKQFAVSEGMISAIKKGRAWAA